MTSNTKTMKTSSKINGVDVDEICRFIDTVENDPAFAKMQFRAANQWIDGGLNRSRLKDFYAGYEEDTTRTEPFVLDSDEPKILASNDTAPNAVE